MAKHTKDLVSPEKGRDNGVQSDPAQDEAENDIANGVTQHLGSDLPDIPPRTQSSPVAEEQQDTMGAQQSTVSEDPQTEQGKADARPVGMRTRKSTGQLKNINPAYKKLTLQPSGAAQRPLGGQKTRRKSTSDDIESEAPNPVVPGHSAIHSGVVAFSPMRKQRNKQQQVDSNIAPNANAEASPRRSLRLQEVQEALENDGDNGEENDDQSKDLFPDHVLQKHGICDQDPVLNAEVLTGPRTRRSTAKQRVEHTKLSDGEQAVADSSQKRKRERPRKSAKVNESNTSATENEPSGTQRRSGRLTMPAPATHDVPEQSGTRSKSGRQKDTLIASRKLRQLRSQVAPSSSTEAQDNPDATAAGQAMQANVEEVVDEYEVPDDDEDTKASKVRSRKRKASGHRGIANTAAKRARVDPPQEEAAPQDDAQDGVLNGDRWYGEYHRLGLVFKAVDDIGRNITGRQKNERVKEEHQNHFDLEDDQVETAVDLCTSVKGIFDQLKDHCPRADPQDDSTGPLTDLGEQIGVLCRGSEEVRFNRHNSDRCTNIYTHLVPGLLKLLKSCLLCYEKIDRDSSSDGQITMGHLQIVNRIIKLLLDVIVGVKKYDNPPTEYHIVEPVRNRINAPLKKVYDHFRSVMQFHYMQLNIQAERVEQARQTALHLEQEERRSRQQARIAIWQRKWQQLHEERFWAEGGIMDAAKRKHLELPKYDIDQNGMRFERAEVFHPRVGPPPGLVDLATKRQWTMVQLSALADGLKLYAGQHVFERIFRKYCRRGGDLERYNVTEIVTTAAKLREILMERGEVEKWVTAIPVWTKAHEAIGKENEEIQQTDAEIGAEDGLFVDDLEAVVVEE